MALTFPRDLPFDGCFTAESPFELKYQQSYALTGGAQPNVADLGPAYWVGSFRTEINRRADFAVWSAWMESLRGGLRTFKGRPPRRKWPIQYPKGFAGLLVSGLQFSGSGNLSAIGAQRDTITVNQLPNGFIVSVGDYVSIPVGSRQHLHKITEGGTVASGSVVLSVEPAIRPNATTAIAVKFEAAYCEMVVKAKTESLRPSGHGGVVSFEAIQVLI